MTKNNNNVGTLLCVVNLYELYTICKYLTFLFFHFFCRNTTNIQTIVII